MWAFVVYRLGEGGESVSAHFIVDVVEVNGCTGIRITDFQRDNVLCSIGNAPYTWIEPLVDIETDSRRGVFEICQIEVSLKRMV